MLRRRSISLLVAVGAIASVVGLSGCTAADAPEAVPATQPSPSPVAAVDDAIGEWLSDLGSGAALALAPDGTVSGTDGCNRLHGTWRPSAGEVVFAAAATTDWACEGADLWLSGLATGTVDGEELAISDAAGTGIGTLTRASTAPDTLPSRAAEPFFGTWGTPDAVGRPSIVIAADGSAGGRDGCNFFGGTWTSDREVLEFRKGSATQVGCDAGVDWLADRATATVDGDTLTVFDEAGVVIGTLPRTAKP